VSRRLATIRDFLDIIVAESSFSPYYVQEIDGTMSSLLDTMGIAWRAKLSMQLWCQGLSALSKLRELSEAHSEREAGDVW